MASALHDTSSKPFNTLKPMAERLSKFSSPLICYLSANCDASKMCRMKLT